MLTIVQLEREHWRLREEVGALRFELVLRRHARALKYNSDQPRDDWGRWTGGSENRTRFVQNTAPGTISDASSDWPLNKHIRDSMSAKRTRS